MIWVTQKMILIYRNSHQWLWIESQKSQTLSGKKQFIFVKVLFLFMHKSKIYLKRLFRYFFL